MATLEDKSTAIETIYELSYALDRLNYPELSQLFPADKTFNFDIYAILKLPPKDVTLQEYFQTACSGLGGFDATQHIVSNPIATLNDDGSMHVKVMVTALHVIVASTGIEEAMARVTWNIDLERQGQRWVIVRWKIIGLVPMDRPDIMAKGHERAHGGKLRASIVRA